MIHRIFHREITKYAWERNANNTIVKGGGGSANDQIVKDWIVMNISNYINISNLKSQQFQA